MPPIGSVAVLSRYIEVLRAQGAWRFSISGLVMRMPMSLVGLASILSIRTAYGNYSPAGVVSAANILTSCACAHCCRGSWTPTGSAG